MAVHLGVDGSGSLAWGVNVSGGIWLEPGGSGAKGLGGTQEEVGHFADGILCSPQPWDLSPHPKCPLVGALCGEGAGDLDVQLGLGGSLAFWQTVETCVTRGVSV